MNPLLEVVLRSVAVYFFMFFAIRLFGKNQLSQLSAGDVILLLLISNAVQNAMVGQNTSLLGGLVAALALFLLNFGMKKIIHNSQKIKDLLNTGPIILIKDGVVDEAALKKADISKDELEESIREHGVESIEKVKLAVMEDDGNISIVSTDPNDKIQYTRQKRKFPRKNQRV